MNRDPKFTISSVDDPWHEFDGQKSPYTDEVERARYRFGRTVEVPITWLIALAIVFGVIGYLIRGSV